MEFRVLGPLEVRVRDRTLPLPGTRSSRLVLAALLLEAGKVVPVDSLIAIIWGESPPDTPKAQVQAAVSELRKALGAHGERERLRTVSPGYLLRLQPGELDLHDFRHDVELAGSARDGRDPAAWAAHCRQALAWWRGDALADLAGSGARDLGASLNEERWAVLDERIEADLELGRHDDLVPELTELTSREALRGRERLWAQLMRALYRSGRREDALNTFHRAREALADAVGVDPGPQLRALQEEILRDDPGLRPDLRPLGTPDPAARPPCPYRGLRPYGPDDRRLFFGRDSEIDELVRTVRLGGSVTVVGPSGSGKSSLVMAGVLVRLTDCLTVTLRPSDASTPWRALAAALAQVGTDTSSPLAVDRIERGERDGLAELTDRLLTGSGHDRLVVVIDQAEELLEGDLAESARFLGALLGPPAPERLGVLATLRSDFLDTVLDHPGLADALGRRVYPLGAMGRDRLREAITGPIATLPGIRFQDGLVDRLLDDAGNEPGAPALLGLTLTLLWERQVLGVLGHAAYDELGRVPGALAWHAEQEWRRRNLAEDADTARGLFGQLTQVPESGEPSGRVAVRAELDDATWAMAQRLSDTRLVVTGQDAERRPTAQLGHDALIRYWPRLAGWVEEDRDFHRWRAGLRADLERWRRGHEASELLLRGAPLAEGLVRLRRRGAELSPAEREYLRRSESQTRAGGRRRRLLRAGLAAALVIALALGALFVVQWHRAGQAGAQADSRALAAASTAAAGRDPGLAALLALAAHRVAPTPQAEQALFGPYLDTLGADTLASGLPALRQVDYSADGRVVAAESQSGEIDIWARDPSAPARLLRLPAPADQGSPPDKGAPAGLAVAPDASAVWVLGDDALTRIDPITGARRAIPASSYPRGLLAVSQDGTRLVADDWDGRRAQRLREWDTASGRLLGSLPISPALSTADLRAGPAPGSALLGWAGEGGSHLALVDLATGSWRTLPSGLGEPTLTASGDVMVRCGAGEEVSTVRVSDGATLVQARAPLLMGTVFCGGSTAVDDTGTTVVSVAGGQLLRFDLRTGALTRLPAPLGESILKLGPHLITGPAGPRVLASTPDNGGGSCAIWTLPLDDPRLSAPDLEASWLLPGGSGLVGISRDNTRLVVHPLQPGGQDLSTPRPPFPAHESGLTANSDGTLVADRTGGDQLEVRRLPGLEPIPSPPLPPGRLRTLYFDSDGALVTRVDSRVDRWDPRTGAHLAHVDLDRLQPGVSDSDSVAVLAGPDPSKLALLRPGGPDVTLLDVATNRVVATIPTGAAVTGLQFRPGSQEMLLQRANGDAEVWDAARPARLASPWRIGTDPVRAFGFAGPTTIVLLGDQGFQLRTLNGDDPTPALDTGPRRSPLAFEAQSRTLSLVDDSGDYGGLVSIDPAVWSTRLCQLLAGRTLTDAERAPFPAIPDQPLCPR